MKESEKRTVSIFKALGSPTRYNIIILLSNGEYASGKIALILGKTATTISKHLKILRDLDIVCFRTQDNKVFYKLKKKNVLDLIRYTENLFSRV